MKTVPNALQALTPLFALGSLLCLAPWAVQAEDYTYTTNNGTITITGYTGPGGDVTIPDIIDGLPVTTIGASAFYLDRLTSVTIPNSVTTIGDEAFFYCTDLTNVTIGNGVTDIGAGVFYSCRSLTTVTIPHSVTSLSVWAFVGASSLTNITVCALNPAYSSVDGVLFDKGQTELIQYPPDKTESAYTIPDSVTVVGEAAFNSCQNLTSVTVPCSVTSLSAWAFYFSASLTNITVDALNPAYSSVDGVLFDKSQTELIKYPPNKTGSAYTIPDNVMVIGEMAFYWCKGLTNVIIPDGVTVIGKMAFFSCGLTSVIITDSVTTIEDSAFEGCFDLTSVKVPASVTTLGDWAFGWCDSLTGVYFRGNAPTVGTNAFYMAYQAIVYYLPGTTGWGPTFGVRATAWHLPHPVILDVGPSFGVQTNRFSFRISWATNASVVVEASPTLATTTWATVATNTITMGTDPLTDGWTYFSDPQWTDHPSRFYRIRSP